MPAALGTQLERKNVQPLEAPAQNLAFPIDTIATRGVAQKAGDVMRAVLSTFLDRSDQS